MEIVPRVVAKKKTIGLKGKCQSQQSLERGLIFNDSLTRIQMVRMGLPSRIPRLSQDRREKRGESTLTTMNEEDKAGQ